MLLLALPGGGQGWEGSCQSGFSRNPGNLRSGNISCTQPEVRVNREEPVEGGGGGSKGERSTVSPWVAQGCVLACPPLTTSHGPAHLPREPRSQEGPASPQERQMLLL